MLKENISRPAAAGRAKRSGAQFIYSLRPKGSGLGLVL